MRTATRSFVLLAMTTSIGMSAQTASADHKPAADYPPIEMVDLCGPVRDVPCASAEGRTWFRLADLRDKAPAAWKPLDPSLAPVDDFFRTAISIAVPAAPALQPVEPDVVLSAEEVPSEPQPGRLLKRLLAEGKKVQLPKSSRCFPITETLVFGPGSALLGGPGVSACLTRGVPAFVVPPGADDVVIRDVAFRGAGGPEAFGVVRARGFRFEDNVTVKAGSLMLIDAHSCSVRASQFTDNTGPSVLISEGTENCMVASNHFARGASFGVLLAKESRGNVIVANRGRDTAAETVGIQSRSTGNLVFLNTSYATGDNGISITGSQNVVVGNYVSVVAYTGIFSYGSRNLVAGNEVFNSGQVKNPSAKRFDPKSKANYAGISAGGGFGGFGNDNVISANVAVENQAPASQVAGVSVTFGYFPWEPDKAYKQDQYVYMDGRIFQAGEAGNSGSEGIACEVETCQDGALDWSIAGTAEKPSSEPSGNLVKVLDLSSTTLPAAIDETKQHANRIMVCRISPKAPGGPCEAGQAATR